MGLFYTPMKIFHFAEKIHSLPATVDAILPPVQIRIKPTNACNHNCWYCAYRAKDLQLGQDMKVRDFIPLEKMMEIVDDIIDMKVSAVTFSGGGEPFCYPYLLNAAKKLSDSSVKFASLTNGSRVSGEVAEMFAFSATWLRVSMDGWDDESYQVYRRCSDGEFSRIIENMRRFKRLGGNCNLGVSYIVDRRNVNHIVEFVGQMKDIGVNSVKIAPCVVSNSGTENNAYHQPIFEQAKEQVHRAVDEFSDAAFEVYDSYHALDDKFTKTYSWCPYQQILPIIGADLNIYPCQDKAYNLSEGLVGSIRSKRFKDFWFSDKRTFFTINPAKVCNHHCVANFKNKLLLEYLEADPGHLGFV